MAEIPFLRRPGSEPPARLLFYTRAECPLCDDMKAEMERAGLAGDYELVEVDIDGDPVLRERYGLRIPVLATRDQPVLEGRWTADEFARAVRELRRSRGRGAEGR